MLIEESCFLHSFIKARQNELLYGALFEMLVAHRVSCRGVYSGVAQYLLVLEVDSYHCIDTMFHVLSEISDHLI